MDNLIKLEFFNKKNFPKGKWLNEPDLCQWKRHNLSCLVIRDMSLGVWKGFVGLPKTNKFYGNKLENLLLSDEFLNIYIYGGICSAGSLLYKYSIYDNGLWWIGIETTHGGDFMPLLKLDLLDPDMLKISGKQTYKDFSFIRKETNKLAKYLSRM